MAVKTRGDVTVASGFEERRILFSLLSGLAGGVWTLLRSPNPVAQSLSGVAMFVAFSLGRRYALRVSPEGIVLTRYLAWIIPFHRRRYMLDVDVEYYRSLTKDEPGGLCVVDPYPSRLALGESLPFAGYLDWEKTVREREAIVKAIEKARQKTKNLSPTLKHPIFGARPWSDALPIEMATRDARGRIRQIESTKAVLYGAVTIPAGSRFYFNEDRYIDPRREDRLVKIVLRAPTRVAGQVVRAGASLMFDVDTRLTAMRGAFDGEMRIGGNWVDGRDVLFFNKKGVLWGFTLARSGKVGGYEIPASSRFTWWRGDRLLPARWSCWLGGPLVLPEVTLGRGDRIEISKNGKRIVGITPSKDLKLGGLTLKGGIALIPLRRNGRINLRQCRRMGLVEEALPMSRAAASQ